MHTNRSRWLESALLFALLGTVLPASGGPASSERPVLSGVHHTVAPDRTRIVLDLTSQVRYEVRSFKNPDRVAVNLSDVRVAKGLLLPVIEGGVVRRIRINRLPWGTQVVFDLHRAAGWSDLCLQPVESMPDRILIDLIPPDRSAGVIQKGGAQNDLQAMVGAGGAPPPPASATVVPSERVLVVAVDAGHGGKDSGTKGKYNLVEKKLALDIARRVARSIEDTKGFKAVLTRDRDAFLDLVQRTSIAKKKNADVFVSIHLNSAPRRSARGVEVWFISPAGADATARKFLSNGEAAARELGIDEPHSSDVLHMLVDVNQQAMMQRSFLLADEILKATDKPGLPPARGVKQQSFAVLKSIDMPSVLVEAGFLTNTDDAGIVRTPEGRQAVAEAIAAGVVSYLKKYPPPPKNDSSVARKVHTVQKGETLWAISKRYNITVGYIRKINGLDESDVLRVGQELIIREKQ